jgi:hypothetical protein
VVVADDAEVVAVVDVTEALELVWLAVLLTVEEEGAAPEYCHCAL